MSIGLAGFPFRVDVFRERDVDDGAGGLDTIDEEILDYQCSRISFMKDRDEREGFGQASGTHINVSIEGDVDILKSDIIKLSPKSIRSPIKLGDKYRVLFVKPQIDEFGNIHHVNLLAEFEDKDTTK